MTRIRSTGGGGSGISVDRSPAAVRAVVEAGQVNGMARTSTVTTAPDREFHDDHTVAREPQALKPTGTLRTLRRMRSRGQSLPEALGSAKPLLDTDFHASVQPVLAKFRADATMSA